MALALDFAAHLARLHRHEEALAVLHKAHEQLDRHCADGAPSLPLLRAVTHHNTAVAQLTLGRVEEAVAIALRAHNAMALVGHDPGCQ